MSHEVYDGKIKVRWLSAAPANPGAPTTTEINAGTDLTPFLPKNGLNPGGTTNRVAEGSLVDTFDAEVMGTYSKQIAMTLFRNSGADTAYQLFDTYGTTGALVVAPFGITAGQPAEVYPDVQAGIAQSQQTAANEKQKFTVDIAVRATPRLDAVIA